MEKINTLILEHSGNYPQKIKTAAEQFARKLQSFCFCPVSDREYARMEPFTTQNELVELIFEIIKDYKVPDRNSNTYFDAIGYWYCIALLSLSENENILKFLDNLTENLIARKHRDTSLLKRNFQYYATRPALAGIRRKIERYFVELNGISPVYELMELIGMTVPKEEPWQFSLTLANYGRFKYDKDMSDQLKVQHFELRMEFHSPYGDGECYQMDLKNDPDRIHTGYITNIDTSSKIYFPDREVDLPAARSVMKIKETVTEIERICEIKFNKKMIYSYFPKEVKSKKIFEAWLNQNW